MSALLLTLLTQAPLNLNGEPLVAIKCDGGIVCSRKGNTAFVVGTTSGGSGGAPTDATYLTQTPNASLSAEQALSALGTGLLTNTTGTGVVSTYAGSSCGANQYATNTSASGVLTCNQVATNQLSGTITNAQLASTYSGVGACGANTFATTLNGNAAPTCSAVNDATGALKGGVVLTGDLAGTASSPSVVDDSHNHTGTTISALDTGDITTGTLVQARGGTGAGALTCAAGDFLTSNGTAYSCATPPAGGGGYATIQDEGTPLTQRTALNFAGAGVSCVDDTTRTTCTISGGGAGSANVVEVDVNFGSGTDGVSVVVTGQSWVTSTSKVLCSPTLLATSTRAEGEEDAVIEQLSAAIHSRVAGVGFTLVVGAPNGGASGVFKFHCTGA